MNRAKAFTFMQKVDLFLHTWDGDRNPNKLEIWLHFMIQLGAPHSCFIRPLELLDKYNRREGIEGTKFDKCVEILRAAADKYRTHYALELEITYLKHLLELCQPNIEAHEESRLIKPTYQMSLARRIKDVQDSSTNVGNDYTEMYNMCKTLMKCVSVYAKGEKPPKSLLIQVKALRDSLGMGSTKRRRHV